MATADQVIEQTEKRLAEVEALQTSLRQTQEELSAYRELLVQKLELLRNGEPTPPPAAADILLADEVPETTGLPAEEGPAVEPAIQEAQERRSAPRRKGNPVSVQVSNATATTEPFQGWVIDRSSGGLCLLVDQKVEPGRLLSVRPTRCHPGFPWVQIQVKSCRAERGSWNLGCQFEHKLSWTELQLFG